jgi:thiol-disulfide isomerase/thioredoxin
MKYISVLTLAVGLGAVLPAMPPLSLPVLRTAGDFRCLDANGKQISITAFRGKVVVVQFLDTGCPHCQALSRLLTKLQSDYGPKAFQAVGVAFNEGTPELVRDYVKNNNLGIPVGYAPREDVLAYLGISVLERLAVPQVLIIDRHGQVRAQSAPMGTPELQDETYLRQTIGELLK